jgi:shikimate kinase
VEQLEDRLDKLHDQNVDLQELIGSERKRQTAYKQMKTTRDNLLERTANQEAVLGRLLEEREKIYKEIKLMVSEDLQARKAAGAKQENEDDTAKE